MKPWSLIIVILLQICCLTAAQEFQDDNDPLKEFLNPQNKSGPSISPSSSSNSTGTSLTAKSDLDQSNSTGKPGQKCKCMKYYECSESDLKDKDKSPASTPAPSTADNHDSGNSSNPVNDILGIVDVRDNINPCSHYFEVCCKVSE